MAGGGSGGGWSPGIATLFSLGNFFWTQDDAGESPLSLPRRFESFHCFARSLTFAAHCGGKSARVIPRSAWDRTSQIDMQILSQFGSSTDVAHLRRRNIYIYITRPFLLCRLNNTLIFPSSLHPRHFHFLFPCLFHSGFFLSFRARAALGELNILGT